MQDPIKVNKNFLPEDAVNREYGVCGLEKTTKGGVVLPDQRAEKLELTPEEKQWADQAKTIFKKYDSNNDGCISEAELTVLLKGLGDDLNKVEISRLLREADKNGDGKIQFAEFVDWLVKPARDSLGKAVIGYSEAFKPLFQVYDRDDSGSITKDNFEECHCLIQGALRVQDAQDDESHRADAFDVKKDHEEAFELIDKSRTGEISYLEFVDWMKEHVPAKMTPKELLTIFKALAEQLKEAFEHIKMAEEGYIQEKDAHILKAVVKKLADTVVGVKSRLREQTGNVKPQWSEPPTGLSVDRLKASHMGWYPVNTKRVAHVHWEILCIPLPGDYDDPQDRIWSAELVRKLDWKDGKTSKEEPEYYVYERKTFSWAPVSDKSTKVFHDTFDDLKPGIGVFCLLKTSANFGTKIVWSGIRSAIEGAVDMKLISEVQAKTFFDYMINVATQAQRAEGMVDDETPKERADALAEEWLSSPVFVVRPREIMATLSELRIVEIDPAWEDFDALGE